MSSKDVVCAWESTHPYPPPIHVLYELACTLGFTKVFTPWFSHICLIHEWPDFLLLRLGRSREIKCTGWKAPDLVDDTRVKTARIKSMLDADREASTNQSKLWYSHKQAMRLTDDVNRL